jgi:nucleoside-diphosphate kinase
MVLGDCFIGAVITVYSRLLKIVDYGDVYTRSRFETERQRTFALIQPESYTKIGQAIDFISQQGFLISKLKMGRLSRDLASKYLGDRQGEDLTKDVTVGLEIIN